VIFTTDHGTFNGDHGRIGKLQAHEHDAKAHIPFIVAHPTHGHGERRSQLVQLVDIYPTVLAAVGRPQPQTPPDRPLHGVNLLPVIEDSTTHTRDFAVCGQFGHSMSITDGAWILHQSPVASNQPLYWHGYCLAKFLPYPLGPFADGRRPVVGYLPWPAPTWLSDKRSDPNELVNLADRAPAKLRQMQAALQETLIQLRAPPEQIERLRLG
jgi:arylsulfatase A-like enzyme